MITLARQIQLKLKKFDEIMIKLKIKYNDGSNKNEPTNSVNHLDDVIKHSLEKKPSPIKWDEAEFLKSRCKIHSFCATEKFKI